MQTETIFTSFEPIRQYHDLLRQQSGIDLDDVGRIQAIDSFLIKQVIACSPVVPSLIDLAADATNGDSTMLLASQPGVRQIYSSRSEQAENVENALSLLYPDHAEITFLPMPPDQPESWQSLTTKLNPLSPPFFLLAVDQNETLGERIERILSFSKEAVVLMLPIGTVGESRVLETALQSCGIDSPYRLTVARELSPFWGTSQLAVICRKENKTIPAILSRIRQLYQGNFDFLALLEEGLAVQVRANMKINSAMEEELEALTVHEPYNTLLGPGLLRSTYYRFVPMKMRLAFRTRRMAMIQSVRRLRRA